MYNLAPVFPIFEHTLESATENATMNVENEIKRLQCTQSSTDNKFRSYPTSDILDFLSKVTREISFTLLTGSLTSGKHGKELLDTITQHYYSQISNSGNEDFVFFSELIDEEVDILLPEEERNLIATYERKYGMPSAEFLIKWKEGKAPDTFETNTWAALLQY